MAERELTAEECRVAADCAEHYPRGCGYRLLSNSSKCTPDDIVQHILDNAPQLKYS